MAVCWLDPPRRRGIEFGLHACYRRSGGTVRIRFCPSWGPMKTQLSVSTLVILHAILWPSALVAADGEASKPKRTDQIGLYYKPNDTDAVERIFKPGDAVVSRPALWALSAQLDAKLVLPTSEGNVEIEAGTVMPATLVAGLPGSDGETLVFCTVSKAADKVVTTRLLGVLGSKIVDSLSDGQKCLIDSDKDGKAEKAFLLNVGNADDRLPKAIDTVALNVSEFREAGVGNHVSIRLTKSKHIEFIIDIQQQGKSMKFDAITVPEGSFSKRKTVGKNPQFPIEFQYYGAKFTITDFDPETRSATIRFNGQNRDDLVVVPTHTIVRVRYSYY